MRVFLMVPVSVGLLVLSACLVTVPDDDETGPTIRISAPGGAVESGDDPPGGDFVCTDRPEGPVHIMAIASDSGGMAELYLHMIEGRVVPESVTIEPDVSDISWEITTGDTPLSEGDDELLVTLSPPSPGMARSGVTVEFDVTAGERTTAIQSLATDASGNQSITWPFLIAHDARHTSCADQ